MARRRAAFYKKNGLSMYRFCAGPSLRRDRQEWEPYLTLFGCCKCGPVTSKEPKTHSPKQGTEHD